MLLSDFLVGKNLVAVDLLPDQKLINVVLDTGALYGVIVANLESGLPVTRHSITTLVGTVLSVGELQFDTTQHEMLPRSY